MNVFEQLMQALPTHFSELAYQYEAFQCIRKIKSPEELFQIIMLYCVHDLSLKSCAGVFAQTYGRLSDDAIKERLCKSINWIKSLIIHMFEITHRQSDDSLRFVIVDSTSIQERGADGATYRLHTAMDLWNLSLLEVVLSTRKVAESLQHHRFEKGDVVIADRGYSRTKTILPVVDMGVEIVIRYNPNSMLTYEKIINNDHIEFKQIDWQEKLNQNSNQPQVIEAWMIGGTKTEQKYYKVYIHAFPRSEADAEQVRRKIKRQSSKRCAKNPPKAITLYLANWMLIISTLPPTRISAEQIKNIYQARWQIEIAFKRLKSILNIDKLRAKKGSMLAEVYLLGKLFYAVLLEKLIVQKFPHTTLFEFWNERPLSLWRPLTLIQNQVKAGLMALFPMRSEFTEDILYSLSERRRKRKLQFMIK